MINVEEEGMVNGIGADHALEIGAQVASTGPSTVSASRPKSAAFLDSIITRLSQERPLHIVMTSDKGKSPTDHHHNPGVTARDLIVIGLGKLDRLDQRGLDLSLAVNQCYFSIGTAYNV